jgi:hypothetical protein
MKTKGMPRSKECRNRVDGKAQKGTKAFSRVCVKKEKGFPENLSEGVPENSPYLISSCGTTSVPVMHVVWEGMAQ